MKSIKGMDLYGSAINGLALRGNSDIDISVNIKDEILTDQEALLLIQKAFLKLNEDDSSPYLFIDLDVFDASFGSQMTFTVKSRHSFKKNIKLSGDLLLNKVLEKHNGNLLKTYCDIDIRF